MVVRFRMGREDFPANLEDESISTQHVALYFAPAKDKPLKRAKITHLLLDPAGTESDNVAQADARGIITTRGAGWTAPTGRSPSGTWQLAIPDKSELDGVDDILLVISYSGLTPAWPM